MLIEKFSLLFFILFFIGILACIGYYFIRFWFHKKPLKSESQKPKTQSPTPEVNKIVSLKEALSSTRNQFLGRIQNVFSQDFQFKEKELEDLEEILYTSDLGVKAVGNIMESLRVKNESKPFEDLSDLKQALRSHMLEAFDVNDLQLKFPESQKEKTQVWMIVGVNGVGKTTTIGKLSFQAKQKGLKTLVIAGDRFRAAAESQLQVWTDKAGVDFFNPPQVKDPSAVIFDGCQKAKASDYDLVIVDTAGRLHTQEPLIRELEKSKRVIEKVFGKSPEEILQVLDANSGQNALIQVQKFHEILNLTGVILTKLDGSAKGGVALGLVSEHKIPIKAIGVGERVEDLRVFEPEEFVSSILPKS